jgi:RNA ligase (TIGR02306 family)
MILATVGKIVSSAPIQDADRIHSVEVVCGAAGKWTGVVPKTMGIGDRALVFMPDAFLPPDERWAFMEARGWRVRQARFKGAPSEVLIIPNPPERAIGDDLTAELGVTKYEKTVFTPTAELAAPFPLFIPKTDEPNFQTVGEYVARMADEHWYATEKADGSSCTAYVDETGVLHVCSRNYELKEGDSAFWKVARKYRLERLEPGFALQFEVVGPGIQKNPMGLADHEMRAFSLYSVVDGRYLPQYNLDAVCREHELPTARLVETGKGSRTSDELRALANIKYPNGKPGEGVVVRAIDSSWSFKVINLNYKD